MNFEGIVVVQEHGVRDRDNAAKNILHYVSSLNQ